MSKGFKIAALTGQVKELRSQFVDRRSQLMKLRMESTVSENGRERNFPATVPPIKIKVKKRRRKKFSKKNGSRR
jgi:hypothetical protein